MSSATCEKHNETQRWWCGSISGVCIKVAQEFLLRLKCHHVEQVIRVIKLTIESTQKASPVSASEHD